MVQNQRRNSSIHHTQRRWIEKIHCASWDFRLCPCPVSAERTRMKNNISEESDGRPAYRVCGFSASQVLGPRVAVPCGGGRATTLGWSVQPGPASAVPGAVLRVPVTALRSRLLFALSNRSHLQTYISVFLLFLQSSVIGLLCAHACGCWLKFRLPARPSIYPGFWLVQQQRCD